MFKTGTLLQRGLISFFSSRHFFFIAFFFALIGCLMGGGIQQLASAQSANYETDSTPRLSLEPANSSVTSEENLQFSALVTHSDNTAVAWSASAGTISRTGLFAAPKVTNEQTVVVTVTSAVAGSMTTKVTVIPAHMLKIKTGTLPAGTSGSSYDAVLTASGGTSPYHWALASGVLPTGLHLDPSTGSISGIPSVTGTFPVSVILKDAAAHSASQTLAVKVDPISISAIDGPAELPRVYLHTTMGDTPTSGKIINVNAGGDLQAALNNANCGDTIALQAGATFSGVFHFPAKSCDGGHWIIVRTAASDESLPSQGTRITPCYAAVASLPGRPTFNCTSTQNVMAKLVFNYKSGFGPVVFDSGASYYRLIGLEITRSANRAFVSDLISPDNGATADHIVLDRLWVHGTTQDETTRGVYLNGMTSTAVINSFFTDFHCVAISGSCTDSQAIGGGGGNFPAGPYKIVNNFLEAAGENILFGGGPATTTPADILIRQNHIFKPLIWMQGQPGFVGGRDGHPFIVKNNFELKNAQRVLFEGNIVEYTWGGFSQAGYAIGLTPKNQAGSDGANLCPACLVTDVTIRYSTISHAAAGINLANSLSDNKAMAAGGGHYSIHDITIDDINGDYYFGGGPLFLVMNGWSNHILGDILINHITGFGDPGRSSLTVGNNVHNPKMSNFVYTNNLVRAGEYPVWSSGGRTNCAYSGVPKTVIDSCFQPYAFVSNGIIATPANYPPSRWPARNYFPADPATVQFMNYNHGNGGDYHLLSSSPYKNAGTDGKDLGADIDAIQAAIANAH
jgi:Putative Ig domain